MQLSQGSKFRGKAAGTRVETFGGGAGSSRSAVTCSRSGSSRLATELAGVRLAFGSLARRAFGRGERSDARLAGARALGPFSCHLSRLCASGRRSSGNLTRISVRLLLGGKRLPGLGPT